MNELIEKLLRQLSEQNNLRQLRSSKNHGRFVEYDGVSYVNMSSNDYLGLSDDVGLQRQFLSELIDSDSFLMSNSASRLMSGNSEEFDKLESSIASLYRNKSALIFGSGYTVNAGLLPAVVAKEDIVIADKLIHASVIDGLRLCGCEWRRFRHNDLEHLEYILREVEKKSKRNVWVVTESIFSMDGDRAPLLDILKLKERYGFYLYLDEAHSFGVVGENGAGLAASLEVDEQVDVIMGTFGKALASYGAFVVLNESLRNLLINRMRPLIFSTALPPINLAWTKFMVDRLADFEDRRLHLNKLISKFESLIPNASHIIPIMTYQNDKALEMANKFKEHNYWVTPIRHPTVPQEEARVRVSISAALGESDIDKFIEVWRSIG